MNMKTVISLFLSLVMLSGCMDVPSESQVSREMIGNSQVVKQCNIVSVRYVTIAEEGPGQQIGKTAGAALGAAIGKQLFDNDAGILLGAIGGMMAGNAAGKSHDAKQSYSKALEIIVQTNQNIGISYRGRNNMRMVVQGINPGDRPLRQGGKCYLTGYGRNARVIAAY